MKKSAFIVFVALTTILHCSVVFAKEAAPAEKLISDIEKYIEVGGSLHSEMGSELERSIIDQIERDGRRAATLLLHEINKRNMPEECLVIYIWAIGLTKDQTALDKLIDICNSSDSEIVKWNALRSLAAIGGAKAGDYLLSQLEEARTKKDSEEDWEREQEFEILNLLAEMQYEKALPEMKGLLRKDYKREYWRSMFCFGKMGDKSINYLLSEINNSDKNVRFNSINLLGRILIDTEAAEPLAKRCWVEEDTEVRRLILSLMEGILPNLDEMKSFFEEVESKEKNQELKKFAQETIDNLDLIREVISEFKAKKKNDRDLFEEKYATIYRSARGNGIIEELGLYSLPEDEDKLKKLRERILSRNSDECFYEYNGLNRIIMLNRLIAENSEVLPISKDKTQ